MNVVVCSACTRIARSDLYWLSILIRPTLPYMIPFAARVRYVASVLILII